MDLLRGVIHSTLEGAEVYVYVSLCYVSHSFLRNNYMLSIATHPSQSAHEQNLKTAAILKEPADTWPVHFYNSKRSDSILLFSCSSFSYFMHQHRSIHD